MSTLAKSCSSSTLSVLAASPLCHRPRFQETGLDFTCSLSSGRLLAAGGLASGFLAAGFFAVEVLVAVFLAGAFLAAGFFAAEALVAVFFAGAFLTGAFLTEEALVTDFFAGAFLAAGFFSAVSSGGRFLLLFHNKTKV